MILKIPLDHPDQTLLAPVNTNRNRHFDVSVTELPTGFAQGIPADGCLTGACHFGIRWQPPAFQGQKATVALGGLNCEHPEVSEKG